MKLRIEKATQGDKEIFGEDKEILTFVTPETDKELEHIRRNIGWKRVK